MRGEKKKGWGGVGGCFKETTCVCGGGGKNKGNRGEGEEDVVHTFVNHILQNCDTKLHIQWDGMSVEAGGDAATWLGCSGMHEPGVA